MSNEAAERLREWATLHAQMRDYAGSGRVVDPRIWDALADERSAGAAPPHDTHTPCCSIPEEHVWADPIRCLRCKSTWPCASMIEEGPAHERSAGAAPLTWWYSGKCPDCGRTIDAELPALPSQGAGASPLDVDVLAEALKVELNRTHRAGEYGELAEAIAAEYTHLLDAAPTDGEDR